MAHKGLHNARSGGCYFYTPLPVSRHTEASVGRSHACIRRLPGQHRQQANLAIPQAYESGAVGHGDDLKSLTARKETP